MKPKEEKIISPEPIMNIATSYWLTKALSAAVDLELFTKIDSGINSVADLRSAIGIEERPLKILLNANVALEMLEKREQEYFNTPISELFLVKGKPIYFGDMVLMQGKRLYGYMANLEETVRQNKPQSDVWEKIKNDEETANIFISAMHNYAVGAAMFLSDKFDFSEYKRLLDIGGGSGAYSVILAQKYDNLHATIFDLASVCKIADNHIKEFKLENRVKTASGDIMKDELPGNFDIALLSQVIHAYGQNDTKKILSNIFKRLQPGGAIIVNEFLLNDDEASPFFPALFSVTMLVESDEGMAYSKKLLCKILKEIGFIEISEWQLVGPITTITAKKALS